MIRSFAGLMVCLAIVAATIIGCVNDEGSLVIDLYPYFSKENVVQDEPIKVSLLVTEGVTLLGDGGKSFELYNSARIFRFYRWPAVIVADVQYRTVNGSKVKRVSMKISTAILARMQVFNGLMQVWYNPPNCKSLERTGPLEISMAPLLGVEIQVRDKKSTPTTLAAIKAVK